MLAARSANVFITHSSKPQGNISSSEIASYPNSLLALRKEKCHSVNDFAFSRKKLGAGKYGTAWKAKELSSGKLVCIKQVNKQTLIDDGNVAQFRREVEIHCRLYHPNIVRLYSYFHDEESCFLVMELANQGTLYEKLATYQYRRVPEPTTARYLRQLCSALSYCHRNNIIHRDIKPENILIFIENNEEVLKLADFGWAVAQRNESVRKTLCGTVEYLPPEVCEGKNYDKPFDAWTVGVLMYELLMGVSPFFSDEEAEMQDYQQRIVNTPARIPNYVSKEARDLLVCLLDKDPRTRIQIHEVLDHPWIRRHAGPTDRAEWDHV